MVTIRMRRHGAKKSPFYRLVVIDSHSARDGRALEVVGHYDPKTQPETLRVDRERIEHWVGRGAQLSDTVRSLLARQPIVDVAESEQTEVVETAGS
jgi:small subunit ribosomal protein S16